MSTALWFEPFTGDAVEIEVSSKPFVCAICRRPRTAEQVADLAGRTCLDCLDDIAEEMEAARPPRLREVL